MNIPLQDWLMANKPSDDMLWKESAWSQFMFARDILCRLIGTSLTYPEINDIVTVISTHRSKSIILPVYRYNRSDIGLNLYLRNNFYNWKLSVISDLPIKSNFDGLFYTTSPIEPEYTGNELSSVYFEGFPSEFIFGYYAESDGKRWSAEIGSTFELWTTLHILLRDLGVIKPMAWHTRESHQKELESRREHAK